MQIRRLITTVTQLLLPVALLVGLAVSYASIETQTMATAAPYSTTDAMIAAHDCWTGAGPADVIPGHVVVTREGATEPTYGGARLAGRALGQIFDGEAHGLTIHGFCR